MEEDAFTLACARARSFEKSKDFESRYESVDGASTRATLTSPSKTFSRDLVTINTWPVIMVGEGLHPKAKKTRKSRPQMGKEKVLMVWRGSCLPKRGKASAKIGEERGVIGGVGSVEGGLLKGPLPSLGGEEERRRQRGWTGRERTRNTERKKRKQTFQARILRGPKRRKGKGRDYSRPTTGTRMPPQERFRHAQEGRASSAILRVEFRVSLWTAAKARKLDCF